MKDSTRLVPRQGDAFEENMAIAEEYKWNEVDPPQAGAIAEWTVPNTACTVRWIEDDATYVGYFNITGNEKDRKTVSDQLESKIEMLHTSNFKEYLEHMDEYGILNDGLFSVATAAPAMYDQATFELYVRYLHHNDSLTRRTALVGIGIMGWPEFIEPVRELLQDPDPKMQQHAQTALGVLNK